MSDREIHTILGVSAVKQKENDKVIPTYKKTNRLVGWDEWNKMYRTKYKESEVLIALCMERE